MAGFDEAGDQLAGNEIRAFLDGIRLMHLHSSNLARDEGEPLSVQLDIPVHVIPQLDRKDPSADELTMIRLKISQESGGTETSGDDVYRHVRLSVEYREGEYIEVYATLIGRRLGIQIQATSERLIGRAEEERASLEMGFQQQGYLLESWSVGRIDPILPNPADARDKGPSRVNVAV